MNTSHIIHVYFGFNVEKNTWLSKKKKQKGIIHNGHISISCDQQRGTDRLLAIFEQHEKMEQGHCPSEVIMICKIMNKCSLTDTKGTPTNRT